MSDIRYSLQVNDKEILRGDPTSLGVFFNNLTGKNSITIEIYERYRAGVQRMVDVSLEGSMKLLDENEKVIREDGIGSDFKNEVSNAEKAIKYAALTSENEELDALKLMPEAAQMPFGVIRMQQERLQRVSHVQIDNILSHLEVYTKAEPHYANPYLHFHFSCNDVLAALNPDLKDAYFYPLNTFSYRLAPEPWLLEVMEDLHVIYGVSKSDVGQHYSLQLTKIIDGDFTLYLKYNNIIGSRFLGYVSEDVIHKFALKVGLQIGVTASELKKNPPKYTIRNFDNVILDLEGALQEIENLSSGMEAKLISLLDRLDARQPDEKLIDTEVRSKPEAEFVNHGRIGRIIPALKAVTYVDDESTTLKLNLKMDPKDYAVLKEVFESIGGKWHRASGTHVFKETPMDHINQIIETGQFKKKYNLGYFPTQPELARTTLEDADIDYFDGMRMLEPSMGQAHFADVAKEMLPGVVISGYEMNPENHAIASKRHDCQLGDFLLQEPTGDYDLVVMNPPFEKQQDIAHVLHAMKFLKPGGQMVAIMSASVTFRTDKKSTAFRDIVEELGGRILVNDSGAFKASGTMVNTVTVIMKNEPAPEFQMSTFQQLDRPRGPSF